MTGMDWISKAARLPGPADSDAQQCVVVWHDLNGAMITGWHQVEANQYMTHWMPCPPPPEGTRAHERMMREGAQRHGG